MVQDPLLQSLFMPKRPGRPASDDVLARRVSAQRFGEQLLVPGIETKEVTLGGVACVVCTPPAARGTIIHLHGGAFRIGGPAAWRPFGTRLAAACGATVILPDYGLAPERPFPEGVRDVLQVWRAAARERGPIIIAGDSAGGGLAMSSVLAAEPGLSAAGVILLSPWLDLTITAQTYASNAASDQMFSRQSAQEAAELYLQGHPADDPLASPVLASVSEAPPTLILVSGTEVLLQDSLTLASKLALAHRRVDLHVAPGLPHVWPVLQPDTPATQEALALAGVFAGVVFSA